MARLGDLIEQIRGVSYKPEDVYDELGKNSITLLRANNIKDGSLNFDDVIYVSKKRVRDNQLLKAGDILICTSSGSKELVGKAAYIQEDLPMTFGAFCKVVRPKKINSGYLGQFFNSPNYRQKISDSSAGVNINNIRNEHIDELDILLPTADRQKHVAAALEKLSNLISLRKQQLAKLDELVKARFVEMFGDENNIKKWPCCTVADVADVCVGVVIKPTQYYADYGIPAFRSLNIGEMYVKDSNWVYFTQEGHLKNQKSVIQENDVLVVRSGAPGTACVATEKYAGYNAVDIIIAHPDDLKISSTFLAMYTNMPHGMAQIREKTGGAAQQHFNVSGYKSLRIMLPPLKYQKEFDTFFKQVEKLNLTIQQSLDKLEVLKKSLMQEYFG